MNTPGASPLFTLDSTREYPQLERGEGVYVYDDQGKQYLDGIAGIGVVNIGYGRREVADRLAAQALKLTYAAPNIFGNACAHRCARQVARLLPAPLTSVHFTSGGSEAVEAAIKLGRQYCYERGRPSKHRVIARWTSYHGATLGALSATGYPGRRKKFEPYLLDWPHIPPAYCYRCPFGLRHPDCRLACAQALDTAIREAGADTVMAFIAEPVVGAAGAALVPPPDYWPRVREICSRHDVLLIADEVITGFGRTGRPFAVNHWNVVPDLMTLAKGISSGYAPLGAVALRTEIREVFERRRAPFDHIFTYAANPVSTAAATEALRIWEDERLAEQAARTGAYLLERLRELTRHPMVGDVRGLGLMAGLEFVRDRATKEPFPADWQVSKRIGAAALRNGLVTYPGAGIVDGVRGDILSLFPPLILTQAQADELVSKLDTALAEVERSL